MPRLRKVPVPFTLVTCHENTWGISVLYKADYRNQEYVYLNSASYGKLLSELVILCEG